MSSSLSSPAHCRSNSSSSAPHSNYSSPYANTHHHQRMSVSICAKRLVPKRTCLQSPRNPHSNLIRMQDGAVVSTVTPIESETHLKKSKNGLSSAKSLEELSEVSGVDISKDKSTVSITVVGASGDLAKKKIFPALFALYYEDCLPKHFTIFGYARSKMSDAELRTMVSRTLTCRIDKRENCDEKMQNFLERCFYHSGQYDSQEDFAELDKKLKKT